MGTPSYSSIHAGNRSTAAPTSSTTSSEGPRLVNSVGGDARDGSAFQAEDLPPGDSNSRDGTHGRISQLERLKMARQSAQANRAASMKLSTASQGRQQIDPASKAASSDCCKAQMSLPELSATAQAGQPEDQLSIQQKGERRSPASGGYMDRFAAVCKTSRSGATPEPSPEAQAAKAQLANAYRHGSARSGLKAPRIVSSPKRLVALSGQPWKAPGAHQGHGNAAGAQRGISHAAAKTSQTCAASQATQEAVDTTPGTACSSGRSEPDVPGLPAPAQRSMSSQGTSPVAAASHEHSVSSSTDGGLQPQPAKSGAQAASQAQPDALPDSCPQAPSGAKPLPAPDVPVESPKPQPGGSQAGSPGHRRTPSRAAAQQPKSPGTPGVLFVQPTLEVPAVQGITAAEKSEKAKAGHSVAALPATSAPQHVSLHAYAAGPRSAAGNAAEKANAQDGAAAKAGLAWEQARNQPAGSQQPWGDKKRGRDEAQQSTQRRKRSLPGLLGALCHCFVPAPSASPMEPAADAGSLESRRSANGQAKVAPLAEEAQTTRHVTESTDFWPSPKRQPRTTDRPSASAALLPPRLDTAQAAFRMGDSLPGPAQRPGTSSAGSEWQGEGMPASQPQQKLLPFVASTMALHAHAPSSRAAQASAQGSPAAEGEAEYQSEHADGAPEEQQESSTLKTQTSLVALLQNEESGALSSAKGSSPKAPRADVNKWFLPGAGKRHDLKAFLEQQHPGMPSALLDPTAPAPWRSPSLRSARPSPKQAAGRSIHSTSTTSEPSPGRARGSPNKQGSPLHVPAYLREGHAAHDALAKMKAAKQVTWKQTHPWSPAKTNIAIVRSPAKAVDSATIRVSRTPGPPRVAELANQRTTTGSESALGHPAQDPGSEAPQQATPAGKRAVRAAISQLREVSQAPPKSRIPAYSPPGPDAGAQPRRERSIRGPGHRPLAGAELAKRGRQLDSKQASPGRRLPHLRAAMMETSVRTNALLLETGGSAGSGLSMQGSRVAMRSIGEAQRAASTERSIHSVASSRGAQGKRGQSVSALERQVLQQYLSARQLRDRAAAQRGDLSVTSRYGSARPASQAGSESAQSEAFGSGRDAMGAKTGPRDSLEAELADLERDWEDLERATAQTAAQDKGEEHEESPPQKGVASVIERWESRNISAEALQHMRGSALRSSWTSEDSASDAQEVSSVRAGKKRSEDSLTHATLDMLQQLSSPVERPLGGRPRQGPAQRDARRPGHSSKVSTDMESICEAKVLPGSLSPLSSAPSAHSLRCAARSAEKLPFASDSSLMAAVTAAASPCAGMPQPASSFSTGLKPQKLADAFHIAAETKDLPGTDSSERSLIGTSLD